MRSLLVVDDEPVVNTAVCAMLRNSRFAPEVATSAEDALVTLTNQEFDAILSDVRMPGISGIDLVREAQKIRPGLRVVLMTGFGSIESAVESIRAGAFDYITKPFKRDQLLRALERALEPERENPPEKPGGERARPRLIGSSSAARTIIELIDKIAASRSNVLITGESGTGKELVARMIHATAMPAEAPFIPVDCSAIPEGLLESELFGHVRGAFTGATEAKKGLFEIANGGTVLLDEIGDMGLSLQAKLLRVLQEREIRRVGGTETIRIDVRCIASTHRDLRGDIETGRFRGDLFYRLNVIPIHVPPLRDRPEDIQRLAEHFVRVKSPETPIQISPEAVAQLERMPWEGNVRELENAIERALAFGDGKSISPNNLMLGEPGISPVAADSENLFHVLANRRIPLREIENRMIAAALQTARGNKAHAARALGISCRTLYRRKATGNPDCADSEPRESQVRAFIPKPLDS